MGRDGKQISSLATSAIVRAFCSADAAKIESVRGCADVEQRPRQRRRHLVVHGAAEQRVRMRNDRDGNRCTRITHMCGNFNRAGLACDK